jgi:hypothetical protein
MYFLFSKLPYNIIKYIITFNDQFIIRNGELVSVIAKTDYRYKILGSIILNFYSYEKWNNIERYYYKFHIFYPYEKIINADFITIDVYNRLEVIDYKVNMWIRQTNLYKTNRRASVINNFTFIKYEYTRKYIII